ncbi:MAG: AIM24 family protein, partial [Planctomycetota bacterium]
RMLEVNLDGASHGMVWTKMGGMVAYRGQVKFTRQGVMEEGLGKFLKRQFTGEGAKLTKAEGQGKVYLADTGKKLTILQLQGDAVVVNGEDLLAFESSLSYDVKMMKKMAAVVSGGLFNVRVEGTGLVCIGTHHDPLTLRVRPGETVFTDPNATVAWSGNLNPGFKTDVSLKTFVGRGSGESFQMQFDGNAGGGGVGWVVVQPYEESPLQASS